MASQAWFQDIVNERLVIGWRVCQSFPHDQWFVQPVVRPEGCFPFVSFFDSYVVKSPTNVKFGKDFGPSKTVKNGFDSRKGVFVSDGPRVDPSIVLCGSFFSILFGDEEEGGHVWGL